MWKRSSNSITFSCCLPINRSNTSPRKSEESHCHNITLATKWIQQLTAADARASFQQLLKAVQARPSTHRKNEKRWHSSLHFTQGNGFSHHWRKRVRFIRDWNLYFSNVTEIFFNHNWKFFSVMTEILWLFSVITEICKSYFYYLRHRFWWK